MYNSLLIPETAEVVFRFFRSSINIKVDLHWKRKRKLSVMKNAAFIILAMIFIMHTIHTKYLWISNYTYKMHNNSYGIICIIISLNNNKHYRAGWGKTWHMLQKQTDLDGLNSNICAYIIWEARVVITLKLYRILMNAKNLMMNY